MDPEDPGAKLTRLIKNHNHALQKRKSRAKREAAILAQRDYLSPTQEEYDEAAASALDFFLKKKDDAIKSDPGNVTVISIAVVSKAGRKILNRKCESRL